MEMVKMWSIMEASTKGKVVEVEGVRDRYYFHSQHHGLLRYAEDVFSTRDDAENAAREKVAKRIASLEKTLAKMRKNPFAAPDPAP